jgi:hypothetical protein
MRDELERKIREEYEKRIREAEEERKTRNAELSQLKKKLEEQERI